MPHLVRSRTIAVGLGVALAAGGLAATTTSGAAGAAGGGCTAWAAVPARVALTAHTVVRPQLVGTAGCRTGGPDAGATATLRGPGRQPNPERWDHFGSREQVDLYRGLDRPGTYTFTGGDVQVYDAGEVRVASTWRTTSFVVKYGSHFTKVTDSHGTTKATLTRDTADGAKRSAHTTVTLQRRTSDGWKTVAHKRTSRTGSVGFTHSKRGDYRLATASTGSTFGAVATVGQRS